MKIIYIYVFIYSFILFNLLIHLYIHLFIYNYVTYTFLLIQQSTPHYSSFSILSCK